jgi:hypothetical protein
MQSPQVAIIKKSGDQLYELSKELRVSEAEYRKVNKVMKIDKPSKMSEGGGIADCQDYFQNPSSVLTVIYMLSQRRKLN